MKNQVEQTTEYNQKNIKWLTYLMFMMFAMTTDAVGVIIPEVMKEFNLSMTAAGLLHYGPMTAIALAGIFLGFLADKIGRKKTIIIGLALFAVNSYLFLLGNTFGFFLVLLIISGAAIGVFKTGALALIGDMSKSTNDHTSTMNVVEGFFGVGAIIGPFLVSYFLTKNVDWKWLYVVAATLCVVLIIIAFFAKYPDTKKSTEEPINIKRTLLMVKDKYALGFSLAAFLYVAVEAAIYVWMPTLIAGYDGSFTFIALYALPIFFILRAGGRFLGAWMLERFDWTVVMAISSFAILLCYAFSFLNSTATVVLLPLSGLFMSVIYPTINSKGISCFPKISHGSVAGIILFFTAAGAAVGPMLMGVVSDLFGSNAIYGFMLATFFAAILFLGFLYNMIFKPTHIRISQLNESEYVNLSKL
ncbi:MFS transporter [Lutibacter maritimus]|uniref:Fucose permease n=1 Tax=Lutibacter maritimus TaxID=593133 RepID=A0A1I6PPK2_9FLAO|nr:MFS transporter [Lutibacter maritimus]SFS42116.1 Fucose permease [Lutibacter maritimus]